MGKFKVGDKVKVLDVNRILYGVNHYFTGMETEVTDIVCDGIHLKNIHGKIGVIIESHEFDAIELIEPKITKNQRITTLENEVIELKNEVAELKLIVHQLREPNKEIVAANLKFESKTIEFEGAKYRKVNREARDGDVMLLNNEQVEASSYLTENKPYKVSTDADKTFVYFKCDDGSSYSVYSNYYKRTIKNLAVYELIVEDKPQIKGNAIKMPPPPLPKTPNQLRAEIIEKAKDFTLSVDDSNFIVNENKRTVVCLTRRTSDNKVHSRSIVKCMPSDVFNEHIGKAIALGRALNLNVSEFEKAVQPIKVVVGMEILTTKYGIKKIVATDAEVDIVNNSCTSSSMMVNQYKDKIINDTNAIYNEVK